MELYIKNKAGQIFLVLYDQSDHELISKHKWYIKSGRHPYVMTCIKGKKVYMHRLLMNVIDSKVCVDHKNLDPLDCRRDNMRLCTKGQNNTNKPGHGGSKFRGVYWNKEKRKWQVNLRINGIYKNVGRYNNEIEAAKAYDSHAIISHGEFVRLNFPA